MSKLATIFFFLLVLNQAATAQYADWKHTGSVCILTTPDGADLPSTTVVENFPLLVRLDRGFVDFHQLQSKGEDLRFSLEGKSLPYQIEDWDSDNGRASVWVRMPRIVGNARQLIQLHWGNANAVSESHATNVFNEANGYASVWHMSEPVTDDAGGTTPKDQGTTATTGIIGQARHLGRKQGILGGEMITGYPSGMGPMSTEAWFRAEQTNGTVLAWGEEKRPSKVMMNFLSPPRIAIQCYFADVEAKSKLSTNEWYQVVHTYAEKDSRVYINGNLDGVSSPVLDLPTTSRLWIGGWYNNYNFLGDVDEVRISKVVRSPEWIKLQYENQKPLQTLVGPVIQSGDRFEVSPTIADVNEGEVASFSVQAGGAQKLYWTMKSGGVETLLAVDQYELTFNAGRVSGDKQVILQCRAVYPSEVKTRTINVAVRETLPDPAFNLVAPTHWDGRKTIDVLTMFTDNNADFAKVASDLTTQWSVTPFAVIQEIVPGKLILKRSQNSGTLNITAKVSNGGNAIEKTVTIEVAEPKHDAWVPRTPSNLEKPQEGQFYSRDDNDEGSLYFNGTLTETADTVFLNVYADDKLYKSEVATPRADGAYRFTVKLKSGLIQYRVEFGTNRNGVVKVLETIGDLVCGDAYLIDGQSNALATDTAEKSPAETNKWIRSYGRAAANVNEASKNLWCNPVWKAQKGEKAELGWWGMKLAERLVESQKIPIFMINGAVGGTRIDQHQRNPLEPADLNSIYGRTLWRVQQAKLTHGIRSILWHQGENDQGADGPSGGYGWETYQSLFVQMSAGWKQDFPNIQQYYVFQIWPDSCSMGGRNGSGDMLRERQRTLPALYSNMSILSTLGVRPAGPCHFPLKGWEEFASMVHPLIERDHYGKVPSSSITPPNLKNASFTSDSRESISLEFDQPVKWDNALVSQFYLDGAKDKVASGEISGNAIILKLKEHEVAKTITYLKEVAWNQGTLLNGVNGMAALTFCEVPIRMPIPTK